MVRNPDGLPARPITVAEAKSAVTGRFSEADHERAVRAGKGGAMRKIVIYVLSGAVGLVMAVGLAVISGSPAQAANRMQIHEIFYNSPGSDTGSNSSLNHEWVQLHNTSGSRIKLTGWTLPYTEITIAAVKDGPMGPRFLFSPETVARAEEFYNKVLSLPYKPGAEGALVDQLSSSAGLIATKKIMDRLPVWLKVEIVGEAVWQWIGLILYLLFTVAALLITYRYVRKGLNLLDTRLHSNFTYSLGGLVLPIILMLFPEPALRFLVYCLHLRNADLYLTIAFVCLLISYAGRIWLYAAVLNRAAAAVIAMAKLEPSGMHAQTIRLAFDVSTVVIVIASTINLGSRLGLPTYSLVTGLGVGGLAVALAAREALSNLIGTIAIFLDRPFKLGDFIVLGDANQGTVAEIGLRSTCIKRMDGVLVSIPNANITKANIINESAPEAEIRISLPIGVAYGSSVNEVEQALLTASKRCDYVSAETAPSVRLVTYGDSAVQFEVLVWIIGPECRGQAKDQINRAIGEEFEKRGIEMPFPQRDVHIHAHK